MPEIYVNDWPPHAPDDLHRREGVVEAARLMLNAAYTAPVAGGVGQIEAVILWGKHEQEKLAKKMEEMASHNQHTSRRFKYEAEMVRESDAIILIGDYLASTIPIDAGCGLCGGEPNCSFLYERKKVVAGGQIDPTERNFDKLVDGPICLVRFQDMSYAVGSALFMSTRLLVDARPYFTVGAAGRQLGYCSDSGVVCGILVAAQQKNPFVDIPQDYHVINMRRIIQSVRHWYIINRNTAGDYRFFDPSADLEKEMLQQQQEEQAEKEGDEE